MNSVGQEFKYSRNGFSLSRYICFFSWEMLNKWAQFNCLGKASSVTGLVPGLGWLKGWV